MQNNDENVNRVHTSHMWIFIKLSVLTAGTLLFKYYYGPRENDISGNTTAVPIGREGVFDNNNLTAVINANGEEVTNKQKITIRIKPQPACPISDYKFILGDICDEYIRKRYSCRPEDIHNPAKHKIPKHYYHTAKNNSSNETQSTVVNYIIAALLLTSLGAALLELYRAKMSPNPPSGHKKGGAKTPLSRKCSLADLTVMKHQRKELVRRESVLDTTEGRSGDMQPLKQGHKPSPLHRRCSFPVSFPPTEPDGSLSRRTSIFDHPSNHHPIRKLSTVNDVNNEDMWRRGSLAGEDSSPERRHHSRLVHRH